VKNLLYLRDLEQGIEQINRLRQNNAKLDIKPGKETGESIVYVVNERSLPLHATLSVDNSGSKQTGLYIVNAGVFWDNLVNRSDSLNFNISRSLNGEHGGSSQSYALNYSIPHGYFLWSVGANHFSYRQMIEGASVNFKTTGKSDNQMIRMDHVVFRGQRSKVMWNIGATRKDTKNYIEDVFLETSSRTLYLADVGIQSTYQMESATLRGALEFTRSVAAGNATKKITAAEVDYQFSKYELDIGIYGRFGLSGRRFNYSSALHYFYTPTTIVASEALSLGGRYTVRGFDHESVTGFRGGYWRNDLSSSFFPTEQIRLEPFVALDVGHSDAPDYQQQSATLSGGSVGLRCAMRRFYAGVSYSKALSVPRFMARGQHELAAEMQMSF
jgi:hemolysin activation/secretion protein